jgi:putative ABC transport system permease protein
MLFAVAELGRSKLRFGLLTVGAGLLVFVLLFQQALLDAVLDGMVGAIKKQSGPVIVFTREAKRRLGAGLVTLPQSEELAKVPGVGAVGGLGVGLLSYRVPGSDVRANVSVLGYEPGKPGTPTAVRSGRLPAAPDEIVASAEGAAGRFGIGDRLTFEPGAVTLTVVGLTEGALLNIGAATWIPWPSYETLMRRTSPDLGVVLPAVLAVEPAPGVTPEQLIYDINATVPLDAVTREEVADSAPGRGPVRTAFLAVMTLCYVVVGVVIGFFFLTLTLQKESSITLLRAVGANARYLISCLLLEVAVVTAGGLVIGVVLLVMIRPAMRNLVIIEIDPGGMLVTSVPALAVALLGALPPIRRVLRVDPFAVVGRPSLGGVG